MRRRELRRRADAGEPVVKVKGRVAGEFLDLWLPTVELTRRPGTVKKYLEHVERFIAPEFARDEPRAITRNRIEAWHGRIGKKTPKQANRALATLSAFLSWLAHDEIVDRNMASRIRRFPEDQRHVFLDATEISVAATFLERHEAKAAALAVLFSLLTGCRIGEAIAIRKTSPDLKRRVWVKPSAHTKQKKTHIAPLPPAAIPVAAALLKLDPPSERDLRNIINDLRRLLNRPELRVHDLRHTRASALARHGASLSQIGVVLGHTAPATTARYAHLVPGDLVDWSIVQPPTSQRNPRRMCYD